MTPQRSGLFSATGMERIQLGRSTRSADRFEQVLNGRIIRRIANKYYTIVIN